MPHDGLSLAAGRRPTALSEAQAVHGGSGEYEGPPLRMRFPFSKMFRRLLGGDGEPETVLGTANLEASAFFTSHWPFASDAQYQQALRTARSE